MRTMNRMERFTNSARNALTTAQHEAEAMQHNRINSGHLLLGLLEEVKGIAAKALKQTGVTREQVRPLVIAAATARDLTTQPELSDDVKRTLELAVDQARRWGHHYIGTEHMLMGIARQSNSVGMKLLAQLQYTADDLENAVKTALSQTNPEGEEGERFTQAYEAWQAYGIAHRLRISIRTSDGALLADITLPPGEMPLFYNRQNPAQPITFTDAKTGKMLHIVAEPISPTDDEP